MTGPCRLPLYMHAPSDTRKPSRQKSRDIKKIRVTNRVIRYSEEFIKVYQKKEKTPTTNFFACPFCLLPLLISRTASRRKMQKHRKKLPSLAVIPLIQHLSRDPAKSAGWAFRLAGPGDVAVGVLPRYLRGAAGIVARDYFGCRYIL